LTSNFIHDTIGGVNNGGGHMKAVVTVLRTATGTADVEVEIPDDQIKGMSEDQVEQAFRDLAEGRAGDMEFSTDDATYASDRVMVVPTPPAPVFCAFCETEAVARVEGTETPLCHSCRTAYEAGQASPGAAVVSQDEQEADETVVCSVCKQPCNKAAAHLHQGEWIGDECCWDERLRASE